MLQEATIATVSELQDTFNWGLYGDSTTNYSEPCSKGIGNLPHSAGSFGVSAGC